MILCLLAYPGFGKSEIAKEYKKIKPDVVLFHVGHLVKKPEDFKEYLTESELEYIKNVGKDAEEVKVEGKLIGGTELYQICMNVILKINKVHDVILDGFPRSLEQAKLLYSRCEQENVKLEGIYIKASDDKKVQQSLSIYTQIKREKKKTGKEVPIKKYKRFIGKIDTYEKETLLALNYLKENINIRQVYYNIETNRRKFTLPFEKKKKKDGEKHFATESYFYPLNVEDYAKFYTDYNLNGNIDKYPLMATLTLYNNCPDHCRGCFNAHQNDNKIISKDVLRRLLEDLASGGTKVIKVAGREPTAYPYLEELFIWCKELGLQTVMITSGAFISRYKEILRTHCDFLRVSLNANEAKTHHDIHNPIAEADDYNTRVESLKSIVRDRKLNGLITGTSFLIRDEITENEFYPFAKKCKEMGVDFVRFSRINYFNNKENILPEKVLKAFELNDLTFNVRYHQQFVEKNETKSTVGCPALLSRVVILADGSVVSCHSSRVFNSNGINSVYGNINRQSFKDIWTGSERHKLISIVFDNLQNNYDKDKKYKCDFCNCADCKYSGFNAINRWFNTGNIENDKKTIEEYYGD